MSIDGDKSKNPFKDLGKPKDDEIHFTEQEIREREENRKKLEKQYEKTANDPQLQALTIEWNSAKKFYKKEVNGELVELSDDELKKEINRERHQKGLPNRFSEKGVDNLYNNRLKELGISPETNKTREDIKKGSISDAISEIINPNAKHEKVIKEITEMPDPISKIIDPKSFEKAVATITGEMSTNPNPLSNNNLIVPNKKSEQTLKNRG